MLQEFHSANLNDKDGNPAGGSVSGVGLKITWQNGPLGRGDKRLPPNGAFVETVIAAAKQRIEYYQESKFNCEENEQAIKHLAIALNCLNLRTQKREARGVEGTHEK
jgi:hypothetical protein